MYNGIIANNSGTITENAFPKNFMPALNFGLFKPKDWNALAKPCHKWKPKANMANTYPIVNHKPYFASLKKSKVSLCKSL